MEKKIIKMWYNKEGDYLEVLFEQKKDILKRQKMMR